MLKLEGLLKFHQGQCTNVSKRTTTVKSITHDNGICGTLMRTSVALNYDKTRRK